MNQPMCDATKQFLMEHYGVSTELELDLAMRAERNKVRADALKREMGTKLVTHPQSTFTPKKQPVLAGSRLVF